MQVRVHQRQDGTIVRIDPPVRIEGSFAGLGLKCEDCGSGVKVGPRKRPMNGFDEPEPSGGMSFWEFVDGPFLLCYRCAACILATCLDNGSSQYGVEIEPVQG